MKRLLIIVMAACLTVFAQGKRKAQAPCAVFAAVSSDSSGNSFTDPRDGKTYRTVKIGDRIWMAENLNYKTRKSWCYDKQDDNCQKYGRLYDWTAGVWGACPEGWRLPRSEEWYDLAQAVGGYSAAGKKLKSKSQWDGTDVFGFSAVPGGRRDADGSFYYAGMYGYWWSDDIDYWPDKAYGWGMYTGYGFVNKGLGYRTSGFSVRCILETKYCTIYGCGRCR
ncbi:MAG: fibrobacter succinogenes major paralogous domain-containing protein [Chitinispirillia bacterium]|nr:fibrobacter succinogenes major paralogous domain-containing protein [Chitinispirillia bacterium]MCL2242741.1 fibrobacter succinogenes major paralogous domain-containing protein [Chitinispirillia bacterium]